MMMALEKGKETRQLNWALLLQLLPDRHRLDAQLTEGS